MTQSDRDVASAPPKRSRGRSIRTDAPRGRLSRNSSSPKVTARVTARCPRGLRACATRSTNERARAVSCGVAASLRGGGACERAAHAHRGGTGANPVARVLERHPTEARAGGTAGREHVADIAERPPRQGTASRPARRAPRLEQLGGSEGAGHTRDSRSRHTRITPGLSVGLTTNARQRRSQCEPRIRRARCRTDTIPRGSCRSEVGDRVDRPGVSG